MKKFVQENLSEVLEKDSADELMRKLSPEAFLDASLMLEELTKLSRKEKTKRDIASNPLLWTMELAATKEEDELVSHLDLIRMVHVQSETILRYLREGKLVPTQTGPDSKYYFSIRQIHEYAEEYGWEWITQDNLKKWFYEVLSGKRMNYSYKPVLVKAMLEYADPLTGECLLEDIVTYYRFFYAERRAKGLYVEKEKSIFSKQNFTDQEARQVILIYPYKRFADMQLMYYKKEKGLIGFHPCLWDELSEEEKEQLKIHCDKMLERYYARFL